MDPFMARTMVESLSRGINPLTGRVLSSFDVCSKEEIQDALLEVLDHCNIESNEQYLLRLKSEKEAKAKKKREDNAKRYPRSGEPWTSADIETLRKLQRKGYNIYKIASILQRTPGAVSSQIKKLQAQPVYKSKEKK